MPIYYLGRNPLPSGDREVHEAGCSHLEQVGEKQYLGEFVSCYGAMATALQLYPRVNGCAHCAPLCHAD